MSKDHGATLAPPRLAANTAAAQPWTAVVPVLLCAAAMLAMAAELWVAQRTAYAALWAGLAALLAAATWAQARCWRQRALAVHGAAAWHRHALALLPQMVWICDANGRAEHLDQRWAQFSGQPVAQLLGTGWRALVHPADRARVRRDWRAAQATGAQTLADLRLRRADGRYRWCSARFGAERDAQGRITRWIGTCVDVHERHEAHAALARSEQLHRGLLAALTEGVVAYDAQARVTACNVAAQRMLGLRAEDMLGQQPAHWGLVLHDAQGRALAVSQLPLLRVLETGQAQRDRLLSVTRPDGAQRWLRVNAEPVLDGLGGVVCSFSDVSVQQRAHHAGLQQRVRLERDVHARTRQLRALGLQLRETERFARLVADSLPVRLMYWDSDLRCRFVNRAETEWRNEPAAQVIGRTMAEIRGPAFAERVAGRAQAALSGQVLDFEQESRNQRGARTMLRVQYVPDQRDGEVKGFVVLATEITRQKQAEQVLRLRNVHLEEARLRADAANQAKSAFLANMSHEIRTPMNAILGFTHMLRRQIRDPAQQQQVQRIAGAADHLLQLINDILDLSRIEAGKLALDKADFSLDALLSRTRAMVIGSVRDKGLALRMQVAPLPDRLHGDATRLLQALLNLLSNAVKFTARGRITLRVDVLARHGPALTLRFEVRDTGIGIAPDSLARLFTPFAQADGARLHAPGGTGLGLAITRHIAEQMDGQAGARSSPGRGSRFWFTARLAVAAPGETWDATADETPDQTADQTADQAPDAPALALDGQGAPPPPHERAAALAPSQGAGAQVLLVEDDRVNQEVAVLLLQAAGARVDVAGDGEQALQMLRARPYALVFMDVQMPRLDGLQAVRQMRQEPALRHLPVVAMTASAFADERQACLDAGMDDHLSKPVDPRALQAVLQRWLAGMLARPVPAGARRAGHGALQWLDALVDLPAALAHAAGQPEILRRVLRQFVAHYGTVGATLRAQVDAGDLPGAARTLHALRGACSAIGATRLHGMATALESALQAASGSAPSRHAPLRAEAAALCAELDALVQALATHLA